jgi:hypothetical protein
MPSRSPSNWRNLNLRCNQFINIELLWEDDRCTNRTMASIEERTASVSESGGSASPFSNIDDYAVQHPQSPRLPHELPPGKDSFDHPYRPREEPAQSAGLPWTLGSTDGSLAVSLPPPDNDLLPDAALEETVAAQKSLYQDRFFAPSSAAVEAVLAATCEVMCFDIAELWLRTGPKTHQLTHSHLRPTALEDSVRQDLVEVYYGATSSARTHRLSPALCKRAKEAADVVWVTAPSFLRAAISQVRTAVAVPVCHAASNTNLTLLFFSMRRCVVCGWNAR